MIVLALTCGIIFTGCYKTNSEEKETDLEENGFDFTKIGEGTGIIEFRGKSYTLNESVLNKPTGWPLPPRLGIRFYDSNNPFNSNIYITFLEDLYNTWPSLELPAGTYEDINHELTLDNYGIQGYSTSDKMFNTKMVVKKSGDNYEIILTGKTRLYREENSQLEDFRMIWKGKIETPNYEYNVMEYYPCTDMEVLKVFNDEPAIVKKVNLSYYHPGLSDEFVFEIINHQNYDFLFPNFPIVFPVEKIPEQYRQDGMAVKISGNVTNCGISGGTYYAQTRLSLVPIHLFELKSIKNN